VKCNTETNRLFLIEEIHGVNLLLRRKGEGMFELAGK